MSDSIDIKNFVSRWNRMCPVDRWWREKHNISFNSSIHRATSFIDMYIEFWENKLYDNNKLTKEKPKEEAYIKGKGNFLRKRKITEKEIDDLFDSINLDEIE